MMLDRRSFLIGSAALAAVGGHAEAQEGLGPFMPHEGGVLTTAWTNALAPGAESWIHFTKITSKGFDTIREYTTRGVHFDFERAAIRPSSAKLLDDIAKTLKNNIIWTLSITGHTDPIGDPGYNKKLSLSRNR